MADILAADQPLTTNHQPPTTKTPIEERAVYSQREAGIITGTSASTIYRAIKRRDLCAAYLGARVVIRGAELLRWLRASESGGIR